MRDQITSDGLTTKQRAFVEAIRDGMTPTEAAIAAGYGGGRAGQMVAGSRLIRHPKIMYALDADVELGEDEEEDDDGCWMPQPGAQTQFAQSRATIAIYGGSAGGGKSVSLLFDPMKFAERNAAGVWELPSGMRVVAFRRLTGELTAGGGLWDKSQNIYGPLGGRQRRSPNLDWIFPGEGGGTARVEFRHMQFDKDAQSHKGREYAVILFDELCDFSEYQFWYLFSRLRTTCGIKPYVRASCNPDPDSFVYSMVRWWIADDGYAIPERSGVVRWFIRRDGELHWYDSAAEAEASHPELDAHGERLYTPVSFTFILAKLGDNPALNTADPGYRGRMQNLDRVTRERLLGDGMRGGNWLVREGAGMMFDRENFVLADGPPSRVLQTIRVWDKAASKVTESYPNPDWTRGLRVSLCEGGEWWIDDLESLRDGPTAVLGRMREVAELDGVDIQVGIWRDAAQAGLVDVEATRAYLSRFAVIAVASHSSDKSQTSSATHRSSRAKRAFARVWAHRVEAKRVYVRRDALWAKTLIDECHGFPDASKDDIVDCLSLAAQIFPSTEGGRAERPKTPPSSTGLPSRGRKGRTTW